MPAVTDEQKRSIRANNRKKKLTAYIRELIRESNKRQADCAVVLGVSQAAFSTALKNMTFSAQSLLVLFDYLGADPQEIALIFARQ